MVITENVDRIENSFQDYSHVHYFKKNASLYFSPRLVGIYHYVHAHRYFPYYKDHIYFHLYKVLSSFLVVIWISLLTITLQKHYFSYGLNSLSYLINILCKVFYYFKSPQNIYCV